MGNLDRTAMDRITGARGPAVVLRSLFAELNRGHDTKPLYLSPKLVQMDVCRDSGLPGNKDCTAYSEWFIPGTRPEKFVEHKVKTEPVTMVQPSPGLRLAMDPRIPDDHESFMFSIKGASDNSKVEWYVDNELTAVTDSGDYLWPLKKGDHTVVAKIISEENQTETQAVSFLVK